MRGENVYLQAIAFRYFDIFHKTRLIGGVPYGVDSDRCFVLIEHDSMIY